MCVCQCSEHLRWVIVFGCMHRCIDILSVQSDIAQKMRVQITKMQDCVEKPPATFEPRKYSLHCWRKKTRSEGICVVIVVLVVAVIAALL